MSVVPSPLDFDAPPPPDTMILGGGIPGVEYLYVLAKNAIYAQKSDLDGRGPFVPLHNMPMFTIAGEACMLLGRGKPIRNARPGSVRCRFFIDEELEAMLPHTIPALEPTKVAEPAPKPPKPAKTSA